MQWIKTSDTTYKCPICHAEISVEAGEELPGYCKHCETEFDEVPIEARAYMFVVEEIERLRCAPKLNGCEMTPEWAEQLKIFEYFEALLSKGEQVMPTNEKFTPLTDAEIKKVLAYCSDPNNTCEKCVLYVAEENDDCECFSKLKLAALDLINRQQEMIDGLIAGQETLQKSLAEKNAEIEKCADAFCKKEDMTQAIANERQQYYDELQTAKAKIELLNKTIACKRNQIDGLTRLLKRADEIKAEAIKEFTEIIESNDYTGGGVHLEVSRSFWDKTKKEMVGDAE